MSIIVEVSIPSDALALGCIFDDHPEATVEFERIVPVEEELMPYVWLSNAGDDLAAVADTIRNHTDTESVTRLADYGDRALFEVGWKPTVDRAVTALRENHCGCIEVTGTSDGWELRLRFSDREDAMAFNEALTADGVSVTLRRLSDASARAEPAPLSPEQLEAIRKAHRAGYFHVPRESSIEELASETDISNSAFSERLRRGLDRLIERTEFEAERRGF